MKIFIEYLILIILLITITVCSAQTIASDPVVTQPDRTEIDAIWRSLQSITHFETDFVEMKSIAFLDEPIPSSGKMYYQSPDLLVKDTQKPSRETLTITSGKITLYSQVLDVRETIDLSEQPSAQKIVRYMLQVFSGNRDALAKTFSFQYTRTKPDEKMIIDLIPTDPSLKQIMQSMQICLTESNTLESLTLIEVDGDSTITRFSNTRYNPDNLVIPGIETE